MGILILTMLTIGIAVSDSNQQSGIDVSTQSPNYPCHNMDVSSRTHVTDDDGNIVQIYVTGYCNGEYISGHALY